MSYAFARIGRANAKGRSRCATSGVRRHEFWGDAALRRKATCAEAYKWAQTLQILKFTQDLGLSNVVATPTGCLGGWSH